VQSKCNEINSKCKIIIKTFDMIQLASNRDTCQQYIRDVISSNDIPNNDINYLIINAGITQRSLGLETELSVLNYLFQANTLSVASLIQSYVAVIRERKKENIGNLNKHSIFVTSSLAGKIGSPGQACYSMSKFAINGFVEGVRHEMIKDKIHIGTICPGPVKITENSGGGLGSSMGSESGRKTDDVSVNKMEVERCASLFVSACIFGLTDSWLSNNPELLFVYLRQYLPILVGPFSSFIGPSRVQKITRKDT